MNETANQRAAGNGGIALPFQIEHDGPAVPEHGRSPFALRWNLSGVSL